MSRLAAQRMVAVLSVVCIGALVFAIMNAPDSETDGGDDPAAAELSAPQDSDPIPDGIDAVMWRIASVDGRALGESTPATFRISSDPQPGQPIVEPGVLSVDGNDGCNSYSGTAAFDRTRLTYRPGVQTAMACPGPTFGLPAQGDLELADGWLIVRGSPTVVAFADEAGRPDAAPPVIAETTSQVPSEPVSTVADDTPQQLPEEFDGLDGSRWVLTSNEGLRWSSSLTPAFTISSGVAFSGHDGCNRYVGSWWLDGDRLVVYADEPEIAPCRAEVPQLLRPAASFRFEVDDDRLTSGILIPGSGVDIAGNATGTTVPGPVLAPTTVEGEVQRPVEAPTDPHVVFERLSPSAGTIGAAELAGNWKTVEGTNVSFTSTGDVVLEDCGLVGRWSFEGALAIERIYPQFADCEATESIGLSMLLLDSRPADKVEILDDGRLAHTSDGALTLLRPLN